MTKKYRNVVAAAFVLNWIGGVSVAHADPPSAEMAQISQWLHSFTSGVSRFPNLRADAIYIGGGSSRSVLDHVFFNAPLEMRDFDVFVVANQPVSENDARKIGTELASESLGQFSSRDLRPRPRANPNLKGPERYSYNAGYGFFWLKDGSIFDLSIFHSQNDLALNGIFDIDRVRIKVSPNESLTDVAKRIKAVGYEQSIRDGLIEDPHRGYDAWMKKQAHIVNWDALAAEPALATIRAIRTFAKIDFIPDAETLAKFRELAATEVNLNRLQVVRNLLKLLEDSKAAWELKLLASADGLKAFNPELHDFLNSISAEKLREILHARKGADRAMMRFVDIARQISPVATIAMFEDLKVIDTQLAENEIEKLRALECIRLQGMQRVTAQ